MAGQPHLRSPPLPLPKQSDIPLDRPVGPTSPAGHPEPDPAIADGDDAARAAYRVGGRIRELERRVAELTDRLVDAERRAAELLAARHQLEAAAERERDLVAQLDQAQEAAQRVAQEAEQARAADRPELERLTVELDDAIRSRQRAESVLAQVVSSPSWRLTAPLRAVKRRLARR